MKTQLRPCLLVMMASLCPAQIKQTQDEEKKQLTALRDLIKSSLQLDQKEVGRSQTGTGEDQFNLQHLFFFLTTHTHTHSLTLATPRFGASAQCCTMLVASVWLAFAGD